jgi:hypothetical protein
MWAEVAAVPFAFGSPHTPALTWMQRNETTTMTTWMRPADVDRLLSSLDEQPLDSSKVKLIKHYQQKYGCLSDDDMLRVINKIDWDCSRKDVMDAVKACRRRSARMSRQGGLAGLSQTWASA